LRLKLERLGRRTLQGFWKISGGSVYKIDNRPFAPVLESGELAEVWRGHVVVHGVEIAVICDVQRVHTQPDVMRLSFAVF
jgi:hypothetical protein